MKPKKISSSSRKMRLGIQGPSGSGKTHGALMIARGMASDWSKICLIDSEYRSASVLSQLGPFQTIDLTPPFTPERYSEAITACEEAGMEVIIIDSVSQEWNGPGGLLQIHGNMPGNSFTNWVKITPRHNAFIHTILSCKAHVIATIRSKQAYVLNQVNGKYVPEKLGLKGITREGLDYELTTVLHLDMHHRARAGKDRTGLFGRMPPFPLSVSIGEKLRDWCDNPLNANHSRSSKPQSNVA